MLDCAMQKVTQPYQVKTGSLYVRVVLGLVLIILLFISSSSITHAASGAAVAVKASTTSEFVNQIEVEKQVRAFFAKTPVMIEIARCESKFRQYTDSGSVLRGGYNSGMIGVFQFYETIHLKAAAALGFNLATLEGNLGYAQHLYTISGTEPWNSSKSCWNVVKATTTTLSKAEKKKLIEKIETLTKMVATLQKLLVEKQRIAKNSH